MSKVARPPMERITGFAVTAEIGWVEFSSTGEHTPYQAAMLLIAQHGADGLYKFPSEDGGEHTVEIVTRKPNQNGQGDGWQDD